MDALAEEIPAHNRDMLRQDLAASAVTLGMVSTAISVWANVASAANLLTLLGSTLGVAAETTSMLGALIGKPKQPVLYQILSELKGAAEKESLDFYTRNGMLTIQRPEVANAAYKTAMGG